MALTVPASVSSDGTRRTVWLTTKPTDLTAITAAELTAGLDLSFYLVHGSDGFNFAKSQAAIDDNRQGSSQNFQRPGRKSPTLSIRYTFNEETPAENEAALELAEGLTGWFVHLYQVPEDYDPETDGGYAGFTYEVIPATLGEQARMVEEQNAVDRINQAVTISGRIVAGKVPETP